MGEDNEDIKNENNTNNNNGEQRVDIEALLSQVRNEEKNKLYPQIEKLKEQLEKKTQSLNAALLETSELKQALKEKDDEIAKLTEKVDKAKGEGAKEMGKEVDELKKQVEELQKQLESKDAETQKALTEKENQIKALVMKQELDAHKSELVKDLDEDFADLVTGSSVEELDESFKKAKEKQEKILSRFKEEPQPKGTPKPKPSPASMGLKDYKDVPDTIESVRAMSHEEFAALREKIFGKK